MKEFPDFMKNQLNHIDSTQQNTPDIDEYVFCVSGEYVEIFDEKEHILHSGDELLIPKGIPHHGRVTKGTRTIHAFGGKRIL